MTEKMSTESFLEIVQDAKDFHDKFVEKQIQLIRKETMTDPRINTLIRNVIAETFSRGLKEVRTQTDPLLYKFLTQCEDTESNARKYENEAASDLKLKFDSISIEIELLVKTRNQILIAIENTKILAYNEYIESHKEVLVRLAERYRVTLKNGLVNNLPKIKKECNDKILELKATFVKNR